MECDASYSNPSFKENGFELKKPNGEIYLIPRVNRSFENGFPQKRSRMPIETSTGIQNLGSHYNFPSSVNKDLHNTKLMIADSSQNSPGNLEEDYSLLSFFKCCRKLKKSEPDDSEKPSRLKRILGNLLKSILVIFYLAYFTAVLLIHSAIQDSGNNWCNADGFLIIVTAIVITGLFYFKVFKPFVGREILKLLKKLHSKSTAFRKIIALIKNGYVTSLFYMIAIGTIGVFLYIDTKGDRTRLTSTLGILFIILFGFLFSAAPRKVIWRQVIWGIGLQFFLGFIVLRSEVGKATFLCFGDKVLGYIQFTDKGSSFVFGKLVSEMRIFVFKVLSGILFFSFSIKILYYYGAMQWIVKKLGWLLQVTIGTTACESVSAAANIFLGPSESALTIKPFLVSMTKSELHAVMTGGFATVAGSGLAAYMSFGIDPTHLLSASVMSAPAALGLSKLFYPETEISKSNVENIKMEKATEANVLHAAIEGVTSAISLIANITANLIAFIAFITFVDATFNWSCLLIDIDDGVCTFSNVMGYVFTPLAWIMGVPWNDCYYVGQLIGIKTIINEFVGYLKLAEYMKDKVISRRSEIISTYALCGFSNITSIGVQMGALGSMVPERKRDISIVATRAMIAGSMACLMTACVAGTLVLTDDELPKDS